MILLVDVGNTRIKWAHLDGTDLVPVKAIAHAGDLTTLLQQEWSHGCAPSEAWVASVAGRTLDKQLVAWMERTWKLRPRFLVAPATHGELRNGYLVPERLGADRWAAMVGAYHLAGRTAACVADCGTAITIDAIDGSGVHRGGLIIPGIAMMRRALSTGTGLLPQVEGNVFDLFGRDTAQCIQAGTGLGAAAMVEQLATRMADELEGAQLFLTGGDASVVATHIRSSFVHEPDLVLHGLRFIFEEPV